jgi:hypothetical protein
MPAGVFDQQAVLKPAQVRQELRFVREKAMIYLALCFGLTAASAMILSRREGIKYDAKVSGRSWEISPDYPATELLDWLKEGVPDGERPNVDGYALILRRYDIILLAALGGALACGSLAGANAMHWPTTVKMALLVLPLAFTVADFTEDMLLLRAFAKKAETVTSKEIQTVQKVTRTKIVALKLAFVQITTVSILWGASNL